MSHPRRADAIAQDILFRAHLHPRRLLNDLSQTQRQALFLAEKIQYLGGSCYLCPDCQN